MIGSHDQMTERSNSKVLINHQQDQRYCDGSLEQFASPRRKFDAESPHANDCPCETDYGRNSCNEQKWSEW